MSRDTPGVVHLADLQRYVFSEEYTPQRTPTGAHELTFILPTGIVPLRKSVRWSHTDVRRCQGLCQSRQEACQEPVGSSGTLMTAVVFVTDVIIMMMMTW